LLHKKLLHLDYYQQAVILRAASSCIFAMRGRCTLPPWNFGVVVNMRTTGLLLFAVSLCAVLFGANPRPTRKHAEAKIMVQSSEEQPYDQSAGPALMEIHLNETFTGDIDGESPVRALQVRRDDQSASLVSMQRFRGKLGGHQGSFVLQGQETVEKGKIKATWFVVPGSGTGELSGLRGEGGFEGDFGIGSQGTLDYWFE
jgi:hypothetical protein